MSIQNVEIECDELVMWKNILLGMLVIISLNLIL